MKIRLALPTAIAFVAFTLVLLGGCRPPGMKFVETEAIPQVKDIKTLMWAMADVADPLFGVAADKAPATYGKAEIDRFQDLGRRLQLASGPLDGFRPQEGFKKLAAELGQKGEALQSAAKAGNGARAAEITVSVRKTCAKCHSDFR